MGVHTYVYLGPYIQGTYRKTESERTDQGCTNPDCKRSPLKGGHRRTDDVFCSTCGKLIGPVLVKFQSRNSPFHVIGESLAEIDTDEPGIFYLMPNVTRPGQPRRTLHLDHTDEVHLNLQSVDMQAEVNWLITAFADEMQALVKAYDIVTVKWGLHQYTR